jgi:hypothetical protein
MREGDEMVNRDLAVERGFHGCRVAFPHFPVGEDDVGSAEEGEMEMLLVVFLWESIHVVTDGLYELFQVTSNQEQRRGDKGKQTNVGIQDVYTPFTQHVDRHDSFTPFGKREDETLHPTIDRLSSSVAPYCCIWRDPWQVA